MIRVLIVDDSRMHRTALTKIIGKAVGFEVIGAAEDGEQGVELVHRLKPDIVLMDVNMPRLDGLGATERIMAEKPTPILLMTASENLTGEVDLAYRAIEFGALELIPKPAAMQPEDKATQDLLTRLKLLAGVPVISHVRGRRPPKRDEGLRRSTSSIIRRARKVVAVASSTGGPRALKQFLTGLPTDLGAGVAIVQHMDGMFVDGFVRWLGEDKPIPVSIAEDGRGLHENEVLVAPAGRHMEMGADRRVVLRDADGSTHCPSGDRLLRSVALTYGPRAIGVVLTGMGEDGARGLLSIKEAGGVTFAQDEATSVVYGMPRAAKLLGAAQQVLALGDLAAAVAKACRVTP